MGRNRAEARFSRRLPPRRRGLPGARLAVCLAVLLSGAQPRGAAQGHPGMAWTLIPGPGLLSVNPAFVLLREGEPGRLSIPVGLLGLLAPERNPLLYWSDRDRFRAVFDLLSCFEQIAHLDTFLVNPPLSPETVMIRIERGRLGLSDGDGNPLPLKSSSGFGAIAVAGTPLVPPPLLSLRYRLGPLHLESGVFLGSEGYRFEPSPALEAASESGEFLPDSSYAFTMLFSAAAGVSQSVSLAAPLVAPDGPWAMYGAVRLVGFYTAAYASAAVGASVQTDGDAIPSSASADWDFFYLYPGGGAGGGVRLDLGVALEWESLRVGLSALNLVGASWMRGFELVSPGELEPEDEEVLRSFDRFAPAVVADASVELRPRGVRVVVAADLGYAAAFQTHAGASLFAGPLILRGGLGWNGGLVFGISVGARWRRLIGEIVLTSHCAAFTGERIYGAGLQLALAPRRSDR